MIRLRTSRNFLNDIFDSSIFKTCSDTSEELETRTMLTSSVSVGKLYEVYYMIILYFQNFLLHNNVNLMQVWGLFFLAILSLKLA